MFFVFFLLAQVAPVTSATVESSGVAASLDWSHLAILAVPAAIYLARVLVGRITGSTKKARLARLFAEIASEAADEHGHGTAWAGAVLDRCEVHSAELLAFAQDLLPTGLGGQEPNTGAGGSPPIPPMPPAPVPS